MQRTPAMAEEKTDHVDYQGADSIQDSFSVIYVQDQNWMHIGFNVWAFFLNRLPEMSTADFFHRYLRLNLMLDPAPCPCIG